MFEDTRRIARKPSRRQFATIDKTIDEIYRRYCSGVQINILDISKVFAAGRDAALKGEDIKQAVLDKVAQLRQN